MINPKTQAITLIIISCFMILITVFAIITTLRLKALSSVNFQLAPTTGFSTTNAGTKEQQEAHFRDTQEQIKKILIGIMSIRESQRLHMAKTELISNNVLEMCNFDVNVAKLLNSQSVKNLSNAEVDEVSITILNCQKFIETYHTISDTKSVLSAAKMFKKSLEKYYTHRNHQIQCLAVKYGRMINDIINDSNKNVVLINGEWKRKAVTQLNSNVSTTTDPNAPRAGELSDGSPQDIRQDIAFTPVSLVPADDSVTESVTGAFLKKTRKR